MAQESAMDDIIFDAPIPGEEMTAGFGTRPWHQPPEIEDPVEALDYHLDRLEEPKVKKALLDALELGIPVRDLNLGILRAAVMTAKHDMDTMFIIASVTHEAIELMAEENDIEFVTGFEETEEDREAEYTVNAMKASKILEKHGATGNLDGVTPESLGEAPTMAEPMMDEAEHQMEEEMPIAPPMGLMARKG
jgi:hypothetical protein